MNIKSPFPGVELPEGYEATSSENYSYGNFGSWWPMKWKGAAWICPDNHQIPKEKFDHGFYGGNLWAIFCPGCGGWVLRSKFTWDPTEKQCTMGFARRKSQLEHTGQV